MFEPVIKAKENDSIPFRQDIAKILNVSNVNNCKVSELKNLSIVTGKQAMYIIDWQKSQLVYTHGILEMLGYTKSEFTIDFALNCIHPDDIDVVSRILKGVIDLAKNTIEIVERQYLNLIFRVLKKDGNYLRIMLQSSPYKREQEGQIISNVSVLTDISFMNAMTNLVEWELFADNIDISNFKQNIYKEFANFFTPREKDIVHLIKMGATNKQIAGQLFISPHTVVSHRKNILKKCNCHNSKQLLNFCALSGII